MVEVTLADGRKALKPVVYFAEATRMSIDSSGALIVAAGDLNLTAANDITNSGTLSGAKTTLASTSGSITNSYGKLAATNGDLSVTADQNITNTGGLITGQNVALTATNGNFTNTTETWRQSQTIKKNYQGVWGNDKVIAYNDTTGAKARITATGGNLSITAGKNITDSGATSISATGDASLKAGGNVNLQALTTQTRGLDRERTYESTRTVTQTGANVSAGGNLAITSGAQTTLHGTKAEAGGDLSISSGTDTVIAATQTTKVVERGDGGFGQVWSTEVKNDLADLKAGNDVKIASGLDTVANGVNITASNDVNIASLASTSITSVQDSFEQNIKTKKYTLIVDKKDTVRSKITAGNDVNITATLGDVTLKAAEVTAGKKVTLAALNGDVNLSANKDVDFRHEVKTTEGGMWTTFSDQGRLDEKVQHTIIDAGDGLTISVGTNGTVNVDYKDFGDLNKSVERLSKEPGLEWMAQVKASATPQQWNAIQEAHKSWDYKSQSLNPQAAMMISMAVAIAMTPVAAGWAGTMVGAQKGVELTAMQAVMKASLAAGISSITATAATSLVSNKGDLGATFKELGSSATLRSLATAMVSAGLLQGLSGAGVLNIDMNATDLTGRIQAAALKMTVNTAVNSTIGGQDFKEALKGGLITAGVSIASSVVYEAIGDMALDLELENPELGKLFEDGHPVKAMLHGVVSGGISRLAGSSFETGALSGFITEITSPLVDQAFDTPEAKINAAKLVGALTAWTIADDAGDIAVAAQIATDIQSYNHQLLVHRAQKDFNRIIKKVNADPQSQYKDLKWDNVETVLQRMAEANKSSFIEVDGLDTTALQFVTNYSSITDNIVTDADQNEGILKGLANAFGAWFSYDNDSQKQYGEFIEDTAEVVGIISDVASFATGIGEVVAVVKYGGKNILTKIASNIGVGGIAKVDIPIPGRVQSRVNLETNGWNHVVDRHFNPSKNASQFTVTKDELRSLLQSPEIVKSPVKRVIESNDGLRYVREVNLNRVIGIDKFTNNQATSTITVLSDKFGNLVTATPGLIQ